MARKMIVLALIFVAIAASVSAQAPSSSPTSAPKSAPAPEQSSPAPTVDDIATPPAPGSGAVEGPAPGSDAAPAYAPIADDFLAPPPSAACGLEVSAIAGVAAFVAGFGFIV